MDAHLYEKGILEEIEKFLETILGRIDNNADLMPAKLESVLDPADDDDDEENHDGRACYYYFVSYSNRTLSWLHDFDVTPLH